MITCLFIGGPMAGLTRELNGLGGTYNYPRLAWTADGVGFHIVDEVYHLGWRDDTHAHYFHSSLLRGDYEPSDAVPGAVDSGAEAAA